MSSARRVRATFDQVAPFRDGQLVGVALGFRPGRIREGMERIDDHAQLGPELTVPAVTGLGKVLRILRAARIALPRDPKVLIGRPALSSQFLDRAVGTELMLLVRPRTRLRFVAWTETGIETVDNISEVIEAEEAYLIRFPKGRFPLRVPRESVVRHRTEFERWFEVLDIERA